MDLKAILKDIQQMHPDQLHTALSTVAITISLIEQNWETLKATVLPPTKAKD